MNAFPTWNRLSFFLRFLNEDDIDDWLTTVPAWRFIAHFWSHYSRDSIGRIAARMKTDESSWRFRGIAFSLCSVKTSSYLCTSAGLTGPRTNSPKSKHNTNTYPASDWSTRHTVSHFATQYRWTEQQPPRELLPASIYSGDRLTAWNWWGRLDQ